jgi:hypothetical protein
MALEIENTNPLLLLFGFFFWLFPFFSDSQHEIEFKYDTKVSNFCGSQDYPKLAYCALSFYLRAWSGKFTYHH